jgi:outer membrane protein
MNKRNIKAAVAIASLSLVSLYSINSANADTWGLGAGISAERNPYRETDANIMPFPFISYESDTFYIRGLGAGYHLWKGDNDTLSVNLQYSPMHFTPDDSDNAQMKHLDKRRSTLLAGLGYTYRDDWGMLRTQLSADVLDNSDGFIGDLAYLYAFNVDAWRITPGVGLRWHSGDHNDYYYGISGNESRRSGLDAYDPGSSWSPYFELSTNYQINQNWNVFLNGNYVLLSSTVKDSPMVSRSYTLGTTLGVIYRF